MEKTDIKENIRHIQITKELASNDAINDTEKQEQPSDTSSNEFESDYETATSDIEDNKTEDLIEKFAKLKCNPTDLEVEGENEGKHGVDDILAPVNTAISENEESDIESIEDEDDDDNGWITPGKHKIANCLNLIRAQECKNHFPIYL